MSGCGWTSCFKGVNSYQAHTHIPSAHFSFTMSMTHPTARTQDISTWRLFSAGANGSSTWGSLLLLQHRSILWKQDACSPVVHICHRVSSNLMGNDTRCHCKQRHMEVLSCTPIRQTFSVPLCHVTCVQLTAKTSNVPGTVISQIDNGPSSLQAKYCHCKKFVCLFVCLFVLSAVS